MLRHTLGTLALAVVAAAGCGSSHSRAHDDADVAPHHTPAPRADGPGAAEVQTLTGTLRGGTVAVGGETTGWRLEGEGATGGMDLDVAKVQADAQRLDGKRVSVTGRVKHVDWPERGRTPVLVVESIVEDQKRDE